MEILETVIFSTIYGPVTLGLPFIGIGFLLSKRSARSASMAYILAGLIIFLGFVTFPTYPRYTFENESLYQIDQISFPYVVKRTSWTAITEPLTWFIDFTGSFHIVTFHSELDAHGIGDDLSVPRPFMSVVLQYEQEPFVSIIDAFCDDREYGLSIANAEGVFQYTSRDWQKMDDGMYNMYCAYDWPEHIRQSFKHKINAGEG